MSAAAAPPSDVVLDVEQTIGPEASRTHILLPFSLAQTAGELELGFSYEPHALDDARRLGVLAQEGRRRYGNGSEIDEGLKGPARPTFRNLLTLSLDDPSGFRGCAHRSPLAGPVTIGLTEATPGFLPGPLVTGPWVATISVHGVVTEKCRFTLRVRAR